MERAMSRSACRQHRCRLQRRGVWQNHANGGALAEDAFGFDPAAMELRDVFDDGQTEAGSPQFTAASPIDTIKAFENARQIGRSDAYSFVGNGTHDSLVGRS